MLKAPCCTCAWKPCLFSVAKTCHLHRENSLVGRAQSTLTKCSMINLLSECLNDGGCVQWRARHSWLPDDNKCSLVGLLTSRHLTHGLCLRLGARLFMAPGQKRQSRLLNYHWNLMDGPYYKAYSISCILYNYTVYTCYTYIYHSLTCRFHITSSIVIVRPPTMQELGWWYQGSEDV